MSEFNGKKFYGFSLHKDPALLTTTRNFEFRYTRPENLERVIQKVQLSDGAEAKQKKLLLAKYCKLKKREISTPYLTRDVDVETHVSRKELSKVRELSENEIDQLIGKAKSTISMLGVESIGEYTGSSGESRDGGNGDDGAAMSNAADQKFLEAANRSDQEIPSTCAQPQTSKSNAVVQAIVSKKKSAQMDKILIEEIRNPQPKWVEIEEAPRVEHLTVAELKLPHRIYRRGAKTMSLPTVAWQQLQQTQLQRDAVQQQQQQQQKQKLLTQSQTQTSLNNHMNQQQPVNYDEVTPSSYYVEDSDYEYEMLKRPGYTKYCEKRPPLDEMTNVSNDSGGVPRFIEIEPHIPCMDLSFLKNANPIRYTDLTDELQEEEQRIESQEMKVYIKGLKQVEPTTNDTKTTDKNAKAKKQATEKKHDLTKRKLFNSKQTSKCPTPTTAATAAVKSPQSSPRTKNAKNIKQHEQHSPPHSPKTFIKTPKSLTPRTPRFKNIILTRSIEELKVEKVSLFNKMNTTQERIIEILDKLRMNLLDIYVPDSTYDKSRRQKNAFEFTVRFSRNFLYPLKGMVEDLRTTTKEAFNSTTSNEACMRVANIYALILQSLQTYQRQLRFFSLDQVPQKLSALIDMTHATTNICLEKCIFAANYPIIDCLQDRCTKFIGFLEDLHEERFVQTRDASGKLCSDKSPNKHAAVHAKYDLKMFMNDLNMYEPKLVPKRLPAQSRYRNKPAANGGTSSNNTTARRRMRKIRRHVEEEKSTVICTENSSQMVLTKATEDAIATQIQNYDYEGSSGLLASVQNMMAASNELCLDKNKCEAGGSTLNQAVIDALQMVTKEQVRQVLEPIIQTLGSALDKKNNSETIEAILKALNTKIFSTTGENKKRHDSRNSHMRSKVPDAKVADSTSSILNASTASKAVKHTKKRAERQKHTNTTSRSSSKNNNNNSNNNKNNASNQMYRNVIEIDGGDAGDAGDDANDSYSESNNEEWESLNDGEELDMEKKFDVQVRSRNKLNKQQQQQQQRQQEEAIQQQQKQQTPKIKQQQRAQLLLQRKKLQEQHLLQQQQQLKELHELQQQLRQKQLCQKPLTHRKHTAKRQIQQQVNQQQQQEPQQHSARVQHKSQDRLQQQRSGPQMHQQQIQRKMSQRQVKEKLQPSERECQEKLPLQHSLRQLRHSSGHLNPCATVSNPLTSRKYSTSSTGTAMSTATPLAHSEVAISQRPQKQQQQHHKKQQQQQQEHQQQGEEQQQHRPPAPCHKNKARLFKKRRNPLRSPPPAPTATPLTSARSKHNEQFEQASELEAPEDEVDVSVEELPHAMTNHSSNTSSYKRECNGSHSNNNMMNIKNNNTGDNSEIITTRRHEVPLTATAIGDCATDSTTAAQEHNRSFALDPHEAAAAASAIAVALDSINVGESTNVLNLLQSRVISDVLVKCLVGVNPAAVSATRRSEDDCDDEDDDNENDDDFDGEEEEVDDNETNHDTKHHQNSIKPNVATAKGNDDGSSDTESREVVEVASYVSTSKKRRGRKTLEQQVRQNYQEQLNAMYAASSAFPIQQQSLHMKLLQQQQQQQQEPESQQELHLKLLLQQELQKEPRSHHDLHAQCGQQQLQQQQLKHELQDQKQLHIQQLLLEQALLLQPEMKPPNQQQQQPQQQQHFQLQPQEQRRALNEINFLHAHPSKTNNKENDLSQVFMEVMERNKQQTANRQKGDLNIGSLLNTRDQFLGLCNKNRFYSNPNYAEPWKVFSRLSAKLASEIVGSVEEDFSIGVSKFVQDFLELETHT